MHTSLHRGLTLRSLALALLGMLGTGWLMHDGIGRIGYHFRLGTEALPIPAAFLIVLLLLFCGMGWLLSRREWLTKQELLCVVYILLVAAPVMTGVFWFRVYNFVSPHAIRGQWEAYDTMPQKLQPVGVNVLSGKFTHPEHWELETGLEAEAARAEWSGEKEGNLLRVKNAAQAPRTLRLPISIDSPGVFKRVHYVFGVLARVETEDPLASWSASIHSDVPDSLSVELIQERGNTEPSFLYPTGFERHGEWAFSLPEQVRRNYFLEITVMPGMSVELADAELRDISAYTYTKNGAPVISESKYQELPESERAGLLVRPDNLFSIEGLSYLISGTALWGPWLGPLAWWLAFILLLFTGTFAMALIMRKQWIERERYPLPLATPIADLIGDPDKQETKRALPAICYRGAFWVGFGLSAGYSLFVLWATFNPALPDIAFNVPLQSYIQGPAWGDTFSGVSFQLMPLVIGIGLLMELNIAISLVLGMFLYRMQFFVGHQFGWSDNPDYPYAASQSLGGWLIYGLAVLFLARKYLAKTLKQAFSAGGGGSEEAADGEAESFSYRSSYALLLISLVGLVAWMVFMGGSVYGGAVFAFVLILSGFVYMKLRAECGIPGTGMLLNKVVFVVPAVGGLALAGPVAYALNVELSKIFAGYSLFVVAALQMEFLELSRRYRLKRSHLSLSLLLALAGGVFIGGWFWFTSSYAVGTENYTHSTAFSPVRTNAAMVESELQSATRDMENAQNNADAGSDQKGGVEPETYAFYGAGLLAAGVTWLRQLFAGFWFHPVGVLLGPTALLSKAWGSLFFAWGLRLLILRMGGALTVREKLRPAAVGVILGAIVVYGIAMLINTQIHMNSPGAQMFSAPISP